MAVHTLSAGLPAVPATMAAAMPVTVLAIALAVALLAAAVMDLRHRRIANSLNAAIALAAPAFWWASGLGMLDIGLQLALAAGTLALLSVLFALRAMGGGDVKLLTALALWIRPDWFAQLVMLMALLGGALTIAIAVWHYTRRLRGPVAVPYGVAIAAAGLWVLALHYWPHR